MTCGAARDAAYRLGRPATHRLHGSSTVPGVGAWLFRSGRDLQCPRLRAEITAEWAQRDDSADPQMLQKHNLSFQTKEGRVAWRNDDRADKPRPAFAIAPERLEAELLRVERSNRWALDILAPYAPLVVFYEELFDAAGQFAERMLHDLAAHVGADARDYVRRPLMLK